MAAMAGVIVSATTGVMNALLVELNSLNIKEREELNSLQDELGLLNAALRDYATMEAPNMQVKEWMRQAREVAYDIDDYISLYEHQLRRGKLKSFFSALQGGSSSTTFRSLGGFSCLGFVKQIRVLKARVIEVSERMKRYWLALDNVPGFEASDTTADLGSSSVTVDPQLILMQHTPPVSIDGPTYELVQLLTASEEQHAKVASIVGMAGIGKTTLAMQVYRKLLQVQNFDCWAFAWVGRRPSLRTVLGNIISQIRKQQEDDIGDEHQAIDTLRELLRAKRYLIVIDDIWSIASWKVISCALPQNNSGSMIISTTRIHDVARSCSNHPSDSPYEMKALGYSDSIRLFHRRILGLKEECPKEYCREFHDSFLKICGGLPWAIIVVSSFLARTELAQWKMVNKSTLPELEQYPPLKRMSKILYIIYNDLPFPIKSCLLYLSVFPKNYMINMDRLIWRWIAEGFIPRRGEESAWETGRSYFNELINRSLIHPVFMDDDYDEDGPVGCMVHGTIHDFIVSLSSEENFVMLDEELESRPRDVIRRLSLNYTKQDDLGNKLALDSGSTNLSQARSLTVLGSAQWMPHLASFHLLRVLDLEDAEGLESSSLKVIVRLFNLRYLGLGGEHVTELPKAIGKLELLETLEIRRTKVQKLPPAAGQLQKLARLLTKDVEPDGFEEMQALQELSMIRVNSRRALSFVAKLVKLRQLRILGVRWCFQEDPTSDAIWGYKSDFISSLNQVTKSNINTLSLHSDEASSLDFLAQEPWDPPYRLQKLVIKGSSSYLPRIPRNLAKCIYLSYLEIAINLDRQEDLMIIANLPVLTMLKLSVRGNPVVIEQGFKCLKVFSFQHREGDLGLFFVVGAMPLLRKLCLYFKVLSQQQQHGRFVSGLQHLTSLKQVNATIDCDGAMLTEVVSSEDAMKKEIRVFGESINLKLSRDNEEKMIQNRERYSI